MGTVYKGGLIMSDRASDKIRGLLLLVDRMNMKGLRHWGGELMRRKIPAVISLNPATLESDCEMVKQLAADGFEIAGAYNEGPFWNESYEFQRTIISRTMEKISACIGKPGRVFHAKYFSYNEDTLKIADELGIGFILARGSAGVRGVVYKPQEYGCRIISVSNVPSKGKGTGSLCDESLRCRTEPPATLRELLFSLSVDRIVLVAQTHVSGVKLHWWNVYRDFFDADIVSWQSLDQFCANPQVMPNLQIPYNTAMDYMEPKPLIPLEQEEDLV